MLEVHGRRLQRQRSLFGLEMIVQSPRLPTFAPPELEALESMEAENVLSLWVKPCERPFGHPTRPQKRKHRNFHDAAPRHSDPEVELPFHAIPRTRTRSSSFKSCDSADLL